MSRPVDADAAERAGQQFADLVVIMLFMAAAGQQDDRAAAAARVVRDRPC
jgi:hypothetical protein